VKKLITTCCFAGLAITAQAGESPAPAPAPSVASAGDIFFGGNAREDAWYTYIGSNYAFNGDKSTSGFIAHAMFGYGGYEYDTPLGGVEADMTEFDIGLGYQWILSGHRVSLIGCFNWVDHDLSGNPIDIADNDVEGDASGFKPKLDIWNTDASRFLYGGTATFSTSNNDYWARVLFAPRVGSVYLGPEGVIQGNEEYEEYRLGLCLTGLKLGIFDAGVSCGYAWADADSGSGDQDSVYGAIHISVDF